MKALKITPGEKPYVININNDLKSLQKEVDGLIECVYPFDDDVCIVCNEEGKIINLPPNRVLRNNVGKIYDVVFGTFLIVGLSDDDFDDLKEELITKYSDMFNDTIELAVIGGNINVITLHDDGTYSTEKIVN